MSSSLWDETLRKKKERLNAILHEAERLSSSLDDDNPGEYVSLSDLDAEVSLLLNDDGESDGIDAEPIDRSVQVAPINSSRGNEEFLAEPISKPHREKDAQSTSSSPTTPRSVIGGARESLRLAREEHQRIMDDVSQRLKDQESSSRTLSAPESVTTAPSISDSIPHSASAELKSRARFQIGASRTWYKAEPSPKFSSESVSLDDANLSPDTEGADIPPLASPRSIASFDIARSSKAPSHRSRQAAGLTSPVTKRAVDHDHEDDDSPPSAESPNESPSATSPTAVAVPPTPPPLRLEEEGLPTLSFEGLPVTVAQKQEFIEYQRARYKLQQNPLHNAAPSDGAASLDEDVHPRAPHEMNSKSPRKHAVQQSSISVGTKAPIATADVKPRGSTVYAAIPDFNKSASMAALDMSSSNPRVAVGEPLSPKLRDKSAAKDKNSKGSAKDKRKMRLLRKKRISSYAPGRAGVKKTHEHGKPSTDKDEDQVRLRSEVDSLCNFPEEWEGNFQDERGRVVKEIFTTEAAYVTSLKILCDTKNPPSSLNSPFTPEDRLKIFSNVDTIFNFNKILLKQLKSRLEGWDSTSSIIGDVFLEVVPYFKMYAQYCNNYEHAIKRLQSLAKTPKVKSWLEKHVSEPNNNQALQSFLIMPVQRIPRYMLLLRDLLKQTPEDHADHAKLVEAIELVQEITDSVDKSIEAADAHRTLFALLSRFKGLDIFMEAHRHLVKCARADVTPTAVSQTPVYSHIVLFSDVVAFATPFDDPSIKGMACVPALGFELALTWVKRLDDAEPKFLVFSPEATYEVCASTLEEKNALLEAIETTTKEWLQSKEMEDTARVASYTFESGSEYKGEWRDRRFYGQGSITYTNGTTYTGEWKKGQRDGTGKMVWCTGHTYQGEWKAGMPNGRGKMSDIGGTSYDGEFLAGKRHGSGTMTWANGDTYDGSWFNNTMQGKGTLISSGGTRYAGMWQAGKRVGQGTLTTCQGFQYEGEWLNDRMHGEGTATYANLDVYQGAWKSDVRHGFGKYTPHPDGGERDGLGAYEGDWEYGTRSGHGVERRRDGEEYVGDWANGMRHGVGRVVYAGGRSYEGDWAHGMPEGKGKEVGPPGAEHHYTGGWMRGKRHGEGVFRHLDGSSYAGEWEMGERHGRGKQTYANEDTYVGEWVRDMWHGRGTFENCSRTMEYQGEWEFGRRTGHGKQVDTTGTYEGDWMNNMRHGRGTFTSRDGWVYEGEWRENLRTGEFSRKARATRATRKLPLKELEKVMQAHAEAKDAGALEDVVKVEMQQWKHGIMQEQIHLFPPLLPDTRILE